MSLTLFCSLHVCRRLSPVAWAMAVNTHVTGRKYAPGTTTEHWPFGRWGAQAYTLSGSLYIFSGQMLILNAVNPDKVDQDAPATPGTPNANLDNTRKEMKAVYNARTVRNLLNDLWSLDK